MSALETFFKDPKVDYYDKPSIFGGNKNTNCTKTTNGNELFGNDRATNTNGQGSQLFGNARAMNTGHSSGPGALLFAPVGQSNIVPTDMIKVFFGKDKEKEQEKERKEEKDEEKNEKGRPLGVSQDNKDDSSVLEIFNFDYTEILGVENYTGKGKVAALDIWRLQMEFNPDHIGYIILLNDNIGFLVKDPNGRSTDTLSTTVEQMMDAKIGYRKRMSVADAGDLRVVQFGRIRETDFVLSLDIPKIVQCVRDEFYKMFFENEIFEQLVKHMTMNDRECNQQKMEKYYNEVFFNIHHRNSYVAVSELFEKQYKICKIFTTLYCFGNRDSNDNDTDSVSQNHQVSQDEASQDNVISGQSGSSDSDFDIDGEGTE